MTLYELETALDSGRLFVCVNRAKDQWWKARRNGKTQRWKRDPLRFRIPLKAGLRVTGAVTDADLAPPADWLRIVP
jgi:hypothetical protein